MRTSTLFYSGLFKTVSHFASFDWASHCKEQHWVGIASKYRTWSIMIPKGIEEIRKHIVKSMRDWNVNVYICILSTRSGAGVSSSSASSRSSSGKVNIAAIPPNPSNLFPLS